MGMNGNLKAGILLQIPAFNRQVTLPHFTSDTLCHLQDDRLLENYPYPLPRVDTPEALCTTSPSPGQNCSDRSRWAPGPKLSIQILPPPQSFGIQIEIISQFG